MQERDVDGGNEPPAAGTGMVDVLLNFWCHVAHLSKLTDGSQLAVVFIMRRDTSCTLPYQCPCDQLCVVTRG